MMLASCPSSRATMASASRASSPAVPAVSRAAAAPAPARHTAAVAGSSAAAGPRRGRPLASPPRASGQNWFAEGKQKFFEMLAGSYDAAAVNAFIDEQIASNPAVVFSWTTCPFCVKAKAQLEATGARFKAIEIDTRPDGKAIKAELAKRTGRTSVPQVWIKGEFVGGCNDGPRPGYGVVPLAASGALEAKLRAAGAL